MLAVRFLIVSIMISGCSSYSVVTEHDGSLHRASETEPVNYVLNDGSTIESKEFHHVDVAESVDCIYGIGEQLDRKTGLRKPFRGTLMRSSVDSTNWDDKHQSFACWLSDGSSVRFKESDFVVITPDKGTGVWCAGTLTQHNMVSPFRGKVPTEKIQALQVRKFSAVKTVFLILGIAVPPTVFLMMLAEGLSHI